MYSEEYEAAKKAFINCPAMGWIGLGVPYVIAFKEWWPIMQREKRKALAQQGAEAPRARTPGSGQALREPALS